MTWNSITGWLSTIVRGSWLVLGGLLITQVVTASPRDAEPSPDMEFLEFLGSWQTHDGKWIDPLHVEDIPPAELDSQPTPRSETGKKTTGQHRERRSSGPGHETSPYPEDDVPSQKRGK